MGTANFTVVVFSSCELGSLNPIPGTYRLAGPDAWARLEPGRLFGGGVAALGHPSQQVRHPLMSHPEEVRDARDALSFRTECDDEGTSEIATGLGLAAQDCAHELHRARFVLIGENGLPILPVFPGQAYLAIR